MNLILSTGLLCGLVVTGISLPLVADDEICGMCTRDERSPSGYSRLCRFGPNQSSFVPCNVDVDNLAPPRPPTSGPDLNLTSADVHECSARDREGWQRIVDESLGATGYDLKGALIGEYPAEKFGLLDINNWYPNDVYKQTMCGKLQQFSTYDLHGTAEMDWNNDIIPDPAFAYLFTDVVGYEGGFFDLFNDWSKCGDVSLCVEGEITPDERFYQNPWFRRSGQTSTLENSTGNGATLCTYGPWVRDRSHTFQPEIHPTELYWWKERDNNVLTAETWWLMQLHDDSNRFDDNDNFDFSPFLS